MPESFPNFEQGIRPEIRSPGVRFPRFARNKLSQTTAQPSSSGPSRTQTCVHNPSTQRNGVQLESAFPNLSCQHGVWGRTQQTAERASYGNSGWIGAEGSGLPWRHPDNTFGKCGVLRLRSTRVETKREILSVSTIAQKSLGSGRGRARRLSRRGLNLGSAIAHAGFFGGGLADVNAALEVRAVFNADPLANHITSQRTLITNVHTVAGS